RGVRALALIDLARLPEALAEAESVVHGPYPPGTPRFTAQIALARARVRTGQPEEGVLDKARALPTATRAIMRCAPIAVVDAEALWLGLERPGALEQLRRAFDMCKRVRGQYWNLGDTALWLTLLGEPVPVDEVTPRVKEPYRAHLSGDWRAAAKEWAGI